MTAGVGAAPALSKKAQNNLWAEIFYGMLFHPGITVEHLSRDVELPFVPPASSRQPDPDQIGSTQTQVDPSSTIDPVEIDAARMAAVQNTDAGGTSALHSTDVDAHGTPALHSTDVDARGTPAVQSAAGKMPTLHPTTARSLYGAFIMVALAFSISGCFDAETTETYPSFTTLFGSVFNGCLCWLALAAMAYIVCGWVARRDLSFKTSLVCTGWSFLPLIFVAPMNCFHAFGPIYAVLSAIPFAWTFVLQLVAFAHCLSIDLTKIFALVLIGVPVFLVAYTFWLCCAMAALIQMLMA